MYLNKNDKVLKWQSRSGLINGMLKPTSNGSLNRLAKMVNKINGINNINSINKINRINRFKEGKYLAYNYLSSKRLRALAKTFADCIPKGKFLPAEIQGFLLICKKEPQQALKQVDEWKNTMLEAKEKKAKVVNMQ